MQAPSGPLPFLPADWRQRVAAFQVEGPFRHFADVLRDVAVRHDERSLAIPEVQVFVLAACDLQREAFAVGIKQLTELAQKAQDEWPITEVLADYKVKGKQPWHISKDFDSMQAEWAVLHEFVCRREWLPIKRARAKGQPDWGVSRIRDETTETIDIDAKYKQGAGAVWMRLTWMVRGLALGQHAEAMRRYDWSWDVTETAQDGDGQRFASAFWNLLPTLGETLRELAPWEALILGKGSKEKDEKKEEWSITLDRDDEGSFTLRLHVEVIEPGQERQVRVVEVTGEPARYPGMFQPTAPEMSYGERADSPESIKILTRIFRRLGIEKQAERRQAEDLPCVWVVRWPVPSRFIPDFNPEAIRTIWQKLSDDDQWPPAIVWPEGGFEVCGTPWIPNAAAAPLVE